MIAASGRLVAERGAGLPPGIAGRGRLTARFLQGRRGCVLAARPHLVRRVAALLMACAEVWS